MFVNSFIFNDSDKERINAAVQGTETDSEANLRPLLIKTLSTHPEVALSLSHSSCCSQSAPKYTNRGRICPLSAAKNNLFTSTTPCISPAKMFYLFIYLFALNEVIKHVQLSKDDNESSVCEYVTT